MKIRLSALIVLIFTLIMACMPSYAAKSSRRSASASPIQPAISNSVTGAFTVTEGATFGGGYADSGVSISTAGVLQMAGACVIDGGLTMDTDKFVVANTTGIVTLGGGGTIDNNTSASILNLTETTVKVTGAFEATGASTLTGAVACASTLTSLRAVSTAISASTATLTVAGYPSGSVIPISAATCAVTLPALTSGATYTFIMKGATSFTLTGPSACVMCDGQTAAKTNLVWSTTPLYLCVTVVSDASNWTVISMTTAPDSAS